jgi:hypothetical protein
LPRDPPSTFTTTRFAAAKLGPAHRGTEPPEDTVRVGGDDHPPVVARLEDVRRRNARQPGSAGAAHDLHPGIPSRLGEALRDRAPVGAQLLGPGLVDLARADLDPQLVWKGKDEQDAADLLAERGTYLVADIYNGDYIAEAGAAQGWPAETLAKNEATTQAQRDGFTRAVKAGVRIAYGTDSGVYPHGWNARQLPYMVRHGMTPMAALRSATVVAAELLGWEDRVGSLAPGRFADVIAVPGDPLDDLGLLADVPFVMKSGRILKWDRKWDRPDARLSGGGPYSPE